MSEMFVLRRANGELFTDVNNGRITIPVWSSEEGLARHKERNPELMTFLPTQLTRSLINKTVSGLGGQDVGFFLLSEDDPAADLDDGTPISSEDIFPASEVAGQRVQPQS